MFIPCQGLHREAIKRHSVSMKRCRLSRCTVHPFDNYELSRALHVHTTAIGGSRLFEIVFMQVDVSASPPGDADDDWRSRSRSENRLKVRLKLPSSK